MITVTLTRGHKPALTWEHETDRAALVRAGLLAWLHRCEVEKQDNGDYVVRADEWYKNKS